MNDAKELLGHDEALVDKARATISDLVDIIGELNSYTEQLRELVEQVEGDHDQR